MKLTKPGAKPNKLDTWIKLNRASQSELAFIAEMRAAHECGVGYGWMQQIIEWEWQANSAHGGAWGPEYFEKKIDELERCLDEK